jgi:hypothetical protein
VTARRTFIATLTTGLLATAALTAAVPATAAENGTPITCQTPPVGVKANAIAASLATRFFTLIKNKDNAGMSRFIDPAWMSLSSNGTSRDHNTFIGDLPTITDFSIDHVTARLKGFLLTARYMAKVSGNIAGHPYSADFAPRLSTFTYCSGEWKMLSQGNFDPLIRDPKPAS